MAYRAQVSTVSHQTNITTPSISFANSPDTYTYTGHYSNWIHESHQLNMRDSSCSVPSKIKGIEHITRFCEEYPAQAVFLEIVIFIAVMYLIYTLSEIAQKRIRGNRG